MNAHSEPAIRRARYQDAPRIARLFAAAFHRDPVFDWLARDGKARAPALQRFFHWILEDHTLAPRRMLDQRRRPSCCRLGATACGRRGAQARSRSSHPARGASAHGFFEILAQRRDGGGLGRQVSGRALFSSRISGRQPSGPRQGAGLHPAGDDACPRRWAPRQRPSRKFQSVQFAAL